jgi:hypothetical protein
VTARAPGKRAHRIVASLALLAGFGLARDALAQNTVTVPGKGHGDVAIALQNLFIEEHTISDGTRNKVGTITTNSAFLNFDYGLTDRLAVTVGIPFKSSKYVGPRPHNPANLYDDHGQYFIDDGDFHAGWQDLSVSLRYAWVRKKWMVTPYITTGTPLRDYTTFGHAAVGTGQWRVEAGVSAGRQFSGVFRNLYFVGGIGYAWMQPVDRTVNHATLSAELGWFISPTLSVHANLSRQKTFNGFEFPQDFPNQKDDHYFYHDMNLRNDYLNAGIGIDWQATDRDRLFLNQGGTLYGDNTHIIKYVLTLGYSRSF